MLNSLVLYSIIWSLFCFYMVLNPIITKAEAIKLEQVLKALNIVAFSMSGAVIFHNKIMKNERMCNYTNLKDAQSRKKYIFPSLLVAAIYHQ